LGFLLIAPVPFLGAPTFKNIRNIRNIINVLCGLFRMKTPRMQGARLQVNHVSIFLTVLSRWFFCRMSLQLGKAAIFETFFREP
jgi:hypothetical protein